MRSLCVAALLSSSLLAPRSAEACTPPPPGYWGSSPGSGAMLPSNAVFFAQAFGVAEPQVLVLDFDVFIPLEVTTFGGLLRAEKPADLVIKGPTQVLWTTSQSSVEPLSLDLSFAQELDNTPPSLEGDLEISYEYLPEDEPGLCQPAGFNVRFSFASGRDDWGIAAYAIYEWFPAAPSRLRQARLAPGSAESILMGLHEPPAQAGQHCYFAVAIDVAGQESFGARGGGPSACVELQTTGEVDAGILDLGRPDQGAIDQGSVDQGGTDSGALDLGGAPDAGSGELILDEEKGCGCSGARSPVRASGGLWTAWALLGLLRISRRRR